MPKGDRGSRGKSKGRPNKVKLGIHFIAVPKGTTKEEARAVLRKSARSTTYKLPAGYEVSITWSNDGGKTTREDEWTNAMIDSSINGRGWDKIVLKRLKGA